MRNIWNDVKKVCKVYFGNNNRGLKEVIDEIYENIDFLYKATKELQRFQKKHMSDMMKLQEQHKQLSDQWDKWLEGGGDLEERAIAYEKELEARFKAIEKKLEKK